MKRLTLIISLFLIVSTGFNHSAKAQKNSSENGEIIDIGSRLELFVDNYLIDTLINSTLTLHEPIDKGEVLKFDNPWEGQFSAYCTIIDDAGIFKLYYRGGPLDGKDGSALEYTCYAQSVDGIHWVKPKLGIFDVNNSKANNIVLANSAPFTHNFSPFLDKNPDADPQQKYKSLSGLERTGLVAFVSPDGLHWKKLQEKPVIAPRPHDFDSQNVTFWSEAEQKYVCYFRSWAEYDKRYRAVARTTSTDFINWTEPVQMDYGDTPHEQLYTNQTSPYYRAPHIYISVGARFMKNRQVISEEEAKELNVNPKYFKDCSDAVFMTTRGGNRYTRTFMESFIRPGIGLDNWVSRSNYPALNIIQTGDKEMSVYLNQDYAQPTAHLHRYTLRIDGFASVRAPYKTGEMITKPLRFTGDKMIINFSTSAAGFVKVELLDLDGNKIEGFELENSTEIIGNEIEKRVSWNGNPDLKKLNGKPVRIRIVLKDADLYSIKFK
jgi:hypothetical protein